jgi:hypothetical protein
MKSCVEAGRDGTESSEQKKEATPAKNQATRDSPTANPVTATNPTFNSRSADAAVDIEQSLSGFASRIKAITTFDPTSFGVEMLGQEH